MTSGTLFKSVFCVSLLVLIITNSSSAQTYSLENILGAPYCSDLTKSKSDRYIAWVSNQKGVRSIMLARGPHFTPEALFSSGEDDGQIIRNLTFDPSDTYLYFVNGSGTNRSGEVANPGSYLNYPSTKLWRIRLSDGSVKDVGPWTSFKISPDGTYFISWKGNTLYKISPDGAESSTIARMRGSFSSVEFSPDGKAISFTSNRGDHSFIGVIRFGEKNIQWIAPGVDKDDYARWSPDGNKLAFIRTAGDLRGELSDITGGHPFSILIHDLSKSETEVVWQSPADDGGFAQYYHNEPLRWTKSDHIVFYSEHEEYMKIYAMKADGGNPVSVIDGDCEVEQSSVSVDGSEIFFSSNCGDIDRRDLYSYDLEKNELNRVTQTSHIETHPIHMLEGQSIFLQGSHNVPTSVAIKTGDKVSQIYPADHGKDFPRQQLVQPQQAIFKSSDGTVVHGQLFDTGEGGNKPAVIFMHGGPIRQMLLGYHYSSYYANTYAMNQFLASKGYVVLSVNFRAGIGYGKKFRRAENQGPRGASEYEDILAAARHLQSLPNVDPDRIGLWGGSYGGYLTAMGLARDSDIFKAGVDFHGVHDWAWRAVDFSEGGFWGIDAPLMDEAYRSSPVADVDSWKSPVLFIHGDDDRNVMFGQTTDLVQRLRAKDVHYELLILPDEVHGFYRYDSWYRSFLATADFFDRFLKDSLEQN